MLKNASVRALVCLVVILVSTISSLSSQDSACVSLAWDPSPDASVAGYYVYYGMASGTYTKRADSGSVTSVTISNLIPGLTYYFAVTAYTADLIESDFSNELSFIVPGVLRFGITNAPLLGSVVQIQFPVVANHSYRVQASGDLLSWTDIWQTLGLANEWVTFLDLQGTNAQRRFYRLVFD